MFFLLVEKNYRIPQPSCNPEKAREVILYVLHKCPNIDEKTLQEILYFIDFDYYETYEEHFIGFSYKKEKDA